MDIDEVKTGLTVVSLLMGTINLLWMWVSASKNATAKKVEEIECALDEHGRRIQTVEGELKHLPTKDDVANLNLQLAQVLGQLKVTESELAGVARTVRRVEDHLTAARV